SPCSTCRGDPGAALRMLAGPRPALPAQPLAGRLARLGGRRAVPAGAGQGLADRRRVHGAAPGARPLALAAAGLGGGHGAGLVFRFLIAVKRASGGAVRSWLPPSHEDMTMSETFTKGMARNIYFGG